MWCFVWSLFLSALFIKYHTEILECGTQFHSLWWSFFITPYYRTGCMNVSCVPVVAPHVPHTGGILISTLVQLCLCKPTVGWLTAGFVDCNNKQLMASKTDNNLELALCICMYYRMSSRKRGFQNCLILSLFSVVILSWTVLKRVPR